jgi:hypothetical protein
MLHTCLALRQHVCNLLRRRQLAGGTDAEARARRGAVVVVAAGGRPLGATRVFILVILIHAPLAVPPAGTATVERDEAEQQQGGRVLGTPSAAHAAQWQCSPAAACDSPGQHPPAAPLLPAAAVAAADRCIAQHTPDHELGSPSPASACLVLIILISVAVLRVGRRRRRQGLLQPLLRPRLVHQHLCQLLGRHVLLVTILVPAGEVGQGDCEKCKQAAAAA